MDGTGFGNKRRSRFTPPSPQWPPKPSRALIPQGPSILALNETVQQVSGCGEPPDGFVGGTTSGVEWMFYKALENILGPEDYATWQYQASRDGGRQLGGSVVDFLIRMPKQDIGVRIVTEWWHFGAGSEKQAYDRDQLFALSGDPARGNLFVIDVYDYYFANDPTCKAAEYVANLAIQGIQMPNPMHSGMTWGLG